MSIENMMSDYRTRCEHALEGYLSKEYCHPESLRDAMRYAVLGGGKRVRPLLVYLTGTTLGVAPERLDPPAVAVELIHAYSLVHDDLPAMDDDDLRRGRPTCHRAFNEATAILAGDALQALAFEILAEPVADLPDAQQRAMLHTLARASGATGMAAGQAVDLAAVGQPLEIAALERMHELKTGALIRAAVQLGALSKPGIEDATLAHLDEFARLVGLAFQVRDDILDVEGETDVLGKPQGSDQAHNKPTYTSLLGLDEAKRVADGLYTAACAQLRELGAAAANLEALAAFVVQRNR